MSRFSFIIPAYNCEAYLPKCIKSIVEIDRQDYEILVVDDGSTDGTRDVCRSLATKNGQLKYLYQKNQGVSAARNHGLELADGEYVIFVDADDSIDAVYMRSLLEIIEANADIDIAVFGMAFEYYYKGQVYRCDQMTPLIAGKCGSDEWIQYIQKLYTQNSLSPIWNKVIKRNIIEENGLRLRENMFLYEDLEFSLRCMACCNEVYFSQESIYHYRQTEDEGNAGRRLKRIESISEITDPIETAFYELLEKQCAGAYRIQAQEILLELYLVLAREKIEVSNRSDIYRICDEFANWIEKKQITIPQEQQAFSEMLIKHKVMQLMFHRQYIYLRHKLAVKIKNTRWYQERRKNGH